MCSPFCRVIKKGLKPPTRSRGYPQKGDSQVWQLGADLLWRASAVRSRSSRSRRVAWQQTPGQMSAPAIPPCKCEVRNRLFAEYTGAIKRAIEMERQHLAGLNSGQSDVGRIDQEFESANEARSVARDAYLKHIHEHGCGTGS
jgi:hypothetical protein